MFACRKKACIDLEAYEYKQSAPKIVITAHSFNNI